MLGLEATFKFIPNMLVDVRPPCRLVRFFQNNVKKNPFHVPGFVLGGIVILKTGKGQRQTVASKLEAHYLLKYYCML